MAFILFFEEDENRLQTYSEISNTQRAGFNCLSKVFGKYSMRAAFSSFLNPGGLAAETLAETIESGPLCITDLFQNKSVAYF